MGAGEQQRGGGQKQQRHAPVSLRRFPLFHKIPPPFIPGPAPFNLSSSLPRPWLASPASSTEPQTSRLGAHPGKEGKSASATRDEGGVRWSTVSPLDSRRAHTLISSDYPCLPRSSGPIMSSSSANIHNKRLPCKFSSSAHSSLLFFNSLRMRNRHRIHLVVLDVQQQWEDTISIHIWLSGQQIHRWVLFWVIPVRDVMERLSSSVCSLCSEC